jgi:hypothetical protein
MGQDLYSDLVSFWVGATGIEPVTPGLQGNWRHAVGPWPLFVGPAARCSQEPRSGTKAVSRLITLLRLLPSSGGCPVAAKFTDKRRTDDQGIIATTGDQASDLVLHW